MKTYTAKISYTISETESGIPHIEKYSGEQIIVKARSSTSALSGCLPGDNISYLWDVSWLTDVEEVIDPTEIVE